MRAGTTMGRFASIAAEEVGEERGRIWSGAPALRGRCGECGGLACGFPALAFCDLPSAEVLWVEGRERECMSAFVGAHRGGEKAKEGVKELLTP